ncbi:MAG: c-type cytochrome [Deltaproteobacteria bacterium]|nr:c-type cytochrome [Deltaproteobacteria bacterium]
MSDLLGAVGRGLSVFCLLLVSTSCGVKKIPLPEVPAASGPEVLERGRYLAEHVMGCLDCHSKRDWTKYAGPVIDENRGGGGEAWGEEMGLPGTVVASNITPAALGDWSDAEIARAIGSGVSRDGKALFPIMPYQVQRVADPEDLAAVIAYLRTLEPVEAIPPRSKIKFPVKYFINKVPDLPAPTKRPDPSDSVATGKYLTALAGCTDCHTPMKGSHRDESRYMDGGWEMVVPGGAKVPVPAIHAGESDGIGDWDRDDFIDAFTDFAAAPDRALAEGETQTPMPWKLYGGMTREDLGAIFDYLKTVPAPAEK